MSKKIIELAKLAEVLRTEYAGPRYGVHSEPALADLIRFAELILQECLDATEDLRGYSGVGNNGDPYDTPSWNAALVSLKNLIRFRFYNAN